MSRISDIVKSLADATSTANGHFSTLTLSIHEDAPSGARWRPDRAGSQRRFRKGEDTTSHQALISGMEIEELYSLLTSQHEQNHFKTHTGSGYGLLLTFAQLLLNFLTHASMETSNEQVRLFLDMSRRAVFSLCGCSAGWSQEMAVAALNDLYSIFDSPAPVFVASNPKAPACPDPRLAYINLLEACALFSESGMAAAYAPDRAPLEVLRAHLRDHHRYFAAMELAIDWFKLQGPAELAVKIALDAPVPLLGREPWPPIRPIEWENFHPGYRLKRLAKETAAHFDALGANLETQSRESIDPSYDHTFLKMMLATFAQTRLCRSNERERARAPLPTYNGLVRAMTPNGRRFADYLYMDDDFKPILDHGFLSYAKIQELADRSYVLAYVDGVAAFGDDDSELLTMELPPPVFPLFSVYDRTVSSPYFEEKQIDVLKAVVFDMQLRALGMLNAGASAPEITSQLQREYRISGGERFIREHAGQIVSALFRAR